MTHVLNTFRVVSAGIAIWILVFIILAVWQRVQFEPDSPYDVNRDGKVDIVDVSAVIGHTNPVPKLP